MKLILSAGSLHTHPLPLAFEIARDIGFDGVEVIINHDFEYSGGRELLAEVCKIHPVDTEALEAVHNFPRDGLYIVNTYE